MNSKIETTLIIKLILSTEFTSLLAEEIGFKNDGQDFNEFKNILETIEKDQSSIVKFIEINKFILNFRNLEINRLKFQISDHLFDTLTNASKIIIFFLNSNIPKSTDQFNSFSAYMAKISWHYAITQSYLNYIGKIYNSNNYFFDGYFSPGHDDQPIENQKQFFELIDPTSIGLSINENFIMHPNLSSSGLIALSNKNKFNKTYSCGKVCFLKNCLYRIIDKNSGSFSSFVEKKTK